MRCEKYGFIYITTNNMNGKKYIGKRIYDKRGAWKTYLGSGVALSRAVKKYGRVNFTRSIVDFADSAEELNQKEKMWIKKLDAIDDRVFYNMASGGDGGNVRVGYSDEEYNKSEEKRIKAVCNGHIYGEAVKNSCLTEQQVIEIISRIKNNDFMSDIARDYGVCEITISNIKCKKTWKHLTTNEDFSKYAHQSKKHRSKPVAQYDKNMRFVSRYTDARDAEQETGIGYKLISQVCHGNKKSTHGFIFQFA